MSCCKRPNVIVMDYEADGRAIENRHCICCGTHWHDGKQYTRTEWDRSLEAALQS